MLCVFIHFLYGADCFKIRAANFSSVCVVSVSLLVRINYPAAFVLSGNYSPASLSFVSCWSLRWGSRPLLAPVPEALAAAAPVSRIWLLLSDPLLGNFALDLFFARSCPARRACSVLVRRCPCLAVRPLVLWPSPALLRFVSTRKAHAVRLQRPRWDPRGAPGLVDP